MKNKIALSLRVIFTALSLVAISINGTVSNDYSFSKIALKEIDGLSFSISIAAIFIVFFSKKIWLTIRENSNLTTHFLSILFALFMMIGLSFTKNGSLILFYKNGKQAIFTILALIGYAYLFDYGICFLYKWLEDNSQNLMTVKISDSWCSKNFQLAAFLAILLAWLPYFIVYWPASVQLDGYNQILQAFGLRKITNHHPYLFSYFMAALIAAGRPISDNFGIFVCVCVQGTIQALCFSKVCKIISRWSTKLAFYSVLFFMFVPIWPSFAQNCLKDGPFSALFSLFFAESIRIFVEAKEKKQIPCFKNALLLFLLGLAACLARRNGIYMCLPQLLVLSFLLIGMRKKTNYLCIYMFVCAVMLYGAYYYTQYPLRIALGVEQGSVREMLSIPVQQTARYLKYYGKDVSKEERKALEKVLPIDEIAKLYKPDLSDPVKFKFKYWPKKDELLSYFKAWGSMFKKHPLVYLEAALANNYAYYYPFTWRPVWGTYHNAIHNKYDTTRYFDFHYIFSNTVRDRLWRYGELWKRIPLSLCFIHPGFYTWVLILCWGLFFYRKKERKSSLLFIGVLLSVAVCSTAPVNGYARYAMPSMACAPMIIAFALHMGKKSEVPAALTATENNNDNNIATAVNIESGDTIKEDKNISITIDLNINLSNKIRS